MKTLCLSLLLILVCSGCTKKPEVRNESSEKIASENKMNVDSLKQEARDTMPSGNFVLCDKYKIIKDSVVNRDKGSLVTFSVTYPILDGLEDVNMKNLINTQLKKAASSGFEVLLDADLLDPSYAENMAKDMKTENSTFTGEVSYEVKHCKNDFLSICYYYIGILTPSAHPSVETKCLNLEINSGEIITLNKIFRENVNIKKLITEKIKTDMEGQGIPYSEPDNINNMGYYITNTGLGIAGLFTSHAMAGYSLVIPWNNIKGMLSDYALKITDI